MTIEKYVSFIVLGYYFYANDGISFLNLMFEIDVKMYGTQATATGTALPGPFENDVKIWYWLFWGPGIIIGAAAIFEEDGQLHPTAAGMLMFGDEYNIVRQVPEYFLDYRER